MLIKIILLTETFHNSKWCVFCNSSYNIVLWGDGAFAEVYWWVNGLTMIKADFFEYHVKELRTAYFHPPPLSCKRDDIYKRSRCNKSTFFFKIWRVKYSLYQTNLTALGITCVVLVVLFWTMFWEKSLTLKLQFVIYLHRATFGLTHSCSYRKKIVHFHLKVDICNPWL